MEPSTPLTLAEAAEAARRIESRFPELIRRALLLDNAEAVRRIEALLNAKPELQREFRTLDPSGSLAVKCHYVTGNEDKWDYQIIADDGLRLNFERLARIAGAAIANDPNVDSLEIWLDTLRDCPGTNVEVETVLPVSDTEAHVFERIPNACAESANVLVRLSIASFEQKRGQVVTVDAEIVAPEAPARPADPEIAKATSTESVPSHPKTIPTVRRRKRANNPEVRGLYQEIYNLYQANQGSPNIHLRICRLLDKNRVELPQPWCRFFSKWEDAYQNSGFRRKVAKYISHAVKLIGLQLHR